MRGRIVTALAACALLTAGCASTLDGAGVRATTYGTGTSTAAQTTDGSSDTLAPVTSPQTTGSQIRPVPPAQTSTPSPGTPTPNTGASDQPPGSSALTPDANGETTSPPKTVESTPQGSGSTENQSPAKEFDGASPVDASKFSGTVTDVGFKSPSGNITCGLQDGTVVCQIDKFTYTPPAGDCGASGWGFNFKLGSSGPAALFCAGDVESGGPVLAYGSQITVGAVRCVSRQDGVTCQNTDSGNGFRLSKAAYTFFGGSQAATSKATSRIPSALVGQWGGHGRSLTIAADGTANLVYRAYQFCSEDPTPPCDQMKGNEIISGGHVRAKLSSSSGSSSAQGKITKSNDPKYPVGAPVTATVGGYNLKLSIMPDSPFCAADTPSDHWNCGA